MHKMGSKPKVSVVIPVYNALGTLDRCLAALAVQSETSFEVLLVDNCSTDAGLDLAKEWQRRFPVPLMLLEEHRQGAAAARNTGAKAVNGQWLAFTDIDCVPHVDWLQNGLRLAEKHSARALSGPAWGTMEGDGAAQLLGLTTLSVGAEESWVHDAGITGTHGFAAANLWVHKDLFEAIGGFDVNLSRSGEDLDLCARIYAIGESILHSPSLQVRHIHSSGIGAMWRKMVNYGRSRAYLLRRYGKLGWYVELPLGHSLHLPWPGYVWINASSAEKKMLAFSLVSVASPKLLFLPLAYVLFLAHFLRRRAKALHASLTWPRAAWMACLFLVKSTALTVGRLHGSGGNVWLV